MRLLVPPDALHSASRIDRTSLKLSAPPLVCGQRGDLVAEQRLGRLRQRREHALGLLGDRLGVRDEPEQADPGDERREEREERGVGDAAGEDPDVVLRRLLERPPGDLHQPLAGIWVGSRGLLAGPLRGAGPRCPGSSGRRAAPAVRRLPRRWRCRSCRTRGAAGDGTGRCCARRDRRLSLRLRRAARPTTAQASAFDPGHAGLRAVGRRLGGAGRGRGRRTSGGGTRASSGGA